MNRIYVAAAVVVLLAGFSCTGGDGGNGSNGNAPRYSIGGVVSGLTGSGLVLRNNGADDLDVLSDGSYTFATRLLSGASYSVTVFQQPTGLQICTTPSGTGTVAGANVTDVAMTCCAKGYANCDNSMTNGCEYSLSEQQRQRIIAALPTSLCVPRQVISGPGYTLTVCTQNSCAGGVSGCLMTLQWTQALYSQLTGSVSLAANASMSMPISLDLGLGGTTTCTLTYTANVALSDTMLVSYAHESETIGLSSSQPVSVSNDNITGCGTLGAVLTVASDLAVTGSMSAIIGIADTINNSAVPGTVSCP